MTKGTQLWPGDKMRDFFRTHIRRETGLDDAAADKLSEALTKAVNRMLVWELPPEPEPPQVSERPKAGKPHRGHAHAPVPFNPFAFSATVLFARTGRDGLMKRLAEIKSADNLRALAEAQHLGIDTGLSKLDDLRRAIVKAAEQRLADRKAAAS
jgi:hypothetical protein